jgi:hypothetical protein
MVKGTLLAHLHAFVRSEVGEPGWSSLLAALSPEDARLLGDLVIAGAWRPVGVWNRAVDSFLNGRFSEPHLEMAKLAKLVAERDLTTLFKVVLKMRSPEFVLNRSPSLYNRYFSEGQFHAQPVGPRHWRASLTVPAGENEGPGLFSCNIGICTWLSHALELSGVRPHVTHPKCRFAGSASCEYDLVW